MKISLNICGLIGILFLLAGCVESMADRESEKQELMQLSRDWSDAAASGDMEQTLDYWADDAILMPPGMPAIEGKEAIGEYLQSTTGIPGFQISWEPESAYVSDDGSMGYMIEHNRIAFTDSLGNEVVEFNKGTTVWRKNEDGEWKNVVDIWNGVPSQE